MLNKKAQVSDAITWAVATIIIIIILGVSIFISSTNFFSSKTIIINRQTDLPPIKSFYAYLLTQDNGEIVYEQLKRDKDFNEINGNLAKKIFSNYEDDYRMVWLGVIDKNEFSLGNPLRPSNQFFGRLESNPNSKFFWGEAPSNSKYALIYLNEEKDFLMSLTNLGENE